MRETKVPVSVRVKREKKTTKEEVEAHYASQTFYPVLSYDAIDTDRYFECGHCHVMTQEARGGRWTQTLHDPHRWLYSCPDCIKKVKK